MVKFQADEGRSRQPDGQRSLNITPSHRGLELGYAQQEVGSYGTNEDLSPSWVELLGYGIADNAIAHGSRVECTSIHEEKYDNNDASEDIANKRC